MEYFRKRKRKMSDGIRISDKLGNKGIKEPFQGALPIIRLWKIVNSSQIFTPSNVYVYLFRRSHLGFPSINIETFKSAMIPFKAFIYIRPLLLPVDKFSLKKRLVRRD